MMRSSLTLAPDRRRPSRGGFTLVEVMMAAAVGAMVLAAIASILVMSLRITYKNQQIDASATNTRLVQEHINGEMSIAISQTSPVAIRPQYSLPPDPITTPARYSRVTYKIQVGSFATVQTTTAKSSNTITIVCPTDIVPKVNDYLLMDTPNLGAGIRITGVNPENSSGPVTLTLDTTILAGTIGTTADDFTDPEADALVRLHRQRAYETVAPTPTTSPVTELHWYETWYEPTAADTPFVVLSRNVDSSSRHLFAQVPEDTTTVVGSTTIVTPAAEPAFGWQFSFVSENSGVVLPGSTDTYYQTNYAEGLIMPKSGNPLNTSSILGGGSTTTSTTSTTTSSTTSSTTTSSTTSSYTTTSTTTSLSTTSTTTSVSTTSTTTSNTTTSTTTSSTTTSISTSSTSTSSTTTSSTTSVSTSSTTTSSTTSVSTTSTTTSFSTTSITTSVSTSSISTSSTTSVSTSSTTTSSTSSTTTSSTTSVSTSSTTSSLSTTTSTTSSVSTTSTTSSLSTTSITTSTTTTSIAFDG